MIWKSHIIVGFWQSLVTPLRSPCDMLASLQWGLWAVAPSGENYVTRPDVSASSQGPTHLCNCHYMMLCVINTMKGTSILTNILNTMIKRLKGIMFIFRIYTSFFRFFYNFNNDIFFFNFLINNILRTLDSKTLFKSSKYYFIISNYKDLFKNFIYLF